METNKDVEFLEHHIKMEKLLIRHTKRKENKIDKQESDKYIEQIRKRIESLQEQIDIINNVK